MGWYWNMGASRSMKRVFMEQAAATGELCRGLVSGWRRRDSPVRVRRRRGGGSGEGDAEGNGGGWGRGRRENSTDLYILFTAPHCQSLTILYKPHQSRLSKHLIEWRAHISMAAVLVTS